MQWRVDGGRINKSVPAPEDNDNVLTFYWHIRRTDKREAGRERVGMPRWRSMRKVRRTEWSAFTHYCTKLCIYKTFDLSFSHGWIDAQLSIALQVHSISLTLCLRSPPNTQPLGYFGFSIGSAASHLTSLRHGFITEPDATRMLCVYASRVTHLRTISCFGKLLREVQYTVLTNFHSFPLSFLPTLSRFFF